MSRRLITILAAAVLAVAGLSAAPFVTGTPGPSDLDVFMAKVLAKRDENWKKLQQYLLDEDEQVDVFGPSLIPVWGERRSFSWFIKDGFFIRSPTKVNGVTVSEADRRKEEETYLKRQLEREKRRKAGAPDEAPVDKQAIADASPRDMQSILLQSRQPEFMDSAYFLRFKFEEGKYALVGQEKFDGQDVLRIEYYPARLFSDAQDKQQKRDEAGKQPDRSKDREATLEHMMNKVSLITLWVEPKLHQIVKYTFDNVNFDFLPAAWLVRVTDVKASMTMSQPFKDIWLPRDVQMNFEAMLAMGTFDLGYKLSYHDYREAKTSSRIKGMQ